jgi:hypothetical protein
MTVFEATTSYETWMRQCTRVVEAHLRRKHRRMRDDLFGFLRGSFYRWAQLWPTVCRDLHRAPQLLAVGELHVGSFGTWRDVEGRLCWGVDDFDESYPLPYTNDLVRLAANAKVMIDAEHLTIKLKDACLAILDGYRRTLRNGGCPMVLAEQETNLGRLGVHTIRPPEEFWPTLQALPIPHRPTPLVVGRMLERTPPGPDLDNKVVSREAGLGSLGQERLVAIAHWNGGLVAREAKALVPSACAWLEGRVSHGRRSINGRWQERSAPATRFRPSGVGGSSGVFRRIRIRLKLLTYRRNATSTRSCVPWARRRPTCTWEAVDASTASSRTWVAGNPPGSEPPPRR